MYMCVSCAGNVCTSVPLVRVIIDGQILLHVDGFYDQHIM